MLRAPSGCSSSGRLLRHHDPGLRICSEQLCAQPHSNLYCHCHGKLCSVARGSRAAVGWGPRDCWGCSARLLRLCYKVYGITPSGDSRRCSSPRPNLERRRCWGRTEDPALCRQRAAQGQPNELRAEDHLAKGCSQASARTCAVGVVQASCLPAPQFSPLKGRRQTPLQASPCHAQQHPRGDAAWVY